MTADAQGWAAIPGADPHGQEQGQGHGQRRTRPRQPSNNDDCEHTRRTRQTRPDEQAGSLKVVDPRWAFVLLNSMVQPAEG